MKRIITAAVAACVLCFSAGRAPAMAACPSAMGALLLDSASSSGKFYEYQFSMRGAGPGPIALRLDVFDSGAQKGSLFGASISPAQTGTDLIFFWPTATVTEVRLHELREGTTGAAMSCPVTSAQILNPIPAQTTWSFDERGLVAAAEMPLLQIETAPAERDAPPPLIRKVKPEYSFADREGDVEGTVVVGIAIGPAGQVLNTWVAHSSGHNSLDNAAAAAARASTYLRFQAGGKPIVRTYFASYTFSAD